MAREACGAGGTVVRVGWGDVCVEPCMKCGRAPEKVWGEPLPSRGGGAWRSAHVGKGRREASAQGPRWGPGRSRPGPGMAGSPSPSEHGEAAGRFRKESDSICWALSLEGADRSTVNASNSGATGCCICPQESWWSGELGHG